MLNKLKFLGLCFLVLFILLLAISFNIGTTRSMPDNAIIIVDDESKTYFAPHYFKDNSIQIPPLARYARATEIREKEYKPNEKCRDQGYFCQDGGSILRSLIEKTGLIKRKNRWNEDGSWNW